MATAAQLREAVVDHVRRALPGLSTEHAGAALDLATVHQERSLRQLERHLDERGHELLAGPNSEPWPLVRLVYALHDLGYTLAFHDLAVMCRM